MFMLLLSLKVVLRTSLFCSSMTSICKLDWHCQCQRKMSFETTWCFSRVVKDRIENSFRRFSIILKQLFVIASQHNVDLITFLQHTEWSTRCSLICVCNNVLISFEMIFLSENIFYNNLSLPCSCFVFNSFNIVVIPV